MKRKKRKGEKEKRADEPRDSRSTPGTATFSARRRGRWGRGRGEKSRRARCHRYARSLWRALYASSATERARKREFQGEGKRRAPFSVVQRGCWIKRRGTLPLKAKGVTTVKKRKRKKERTKEKRRKKTQKRGRTRGERDYDLAVSSRAFDPRARSGLSRRGILT